MKAIAAEFFQGSDLMAWPLLTLVMFIAVFTICVVRVVRRGAAAYEAQARLPLGGDEENHER